MDNTKAIAEKLGINLKDIKLAAIEKGAREEWEEHGKGKFKVLKTKEDAIKTALAHLVHDKEYYK